MIRLRWDEKFWMKKMTRKSLFGGKTTKKVILPVKCNQAHGVHDGGYYDQNFHRNYCMYSSDGVPKVLLKK
jgi:hypothetical protein